MGKPALRQKLTDKIDAKQHFYIKFSQYSCPDAVFFPVYSDIRERTFEVGDIVAWFWGPNLTFGIILTVTNQSCMMIETLPRKFIGCATKSTVARDHIVCRFILE